MTAEIKSLEAATAAVTSFSKKRKLKHGGGKGKKKPNKKLKPVAKTKNPSQKMKKLFKKRAKAYNSDESEEEYEQEEEEDIADEQSSDEEEREEEEERDIDASDEEDDGSRLGITKFSEGCRAFRTAFLKIMKKHLPNDPLGPVLSAHKKLIANKLLEEETEHKSKGEAKKEKHLAGEKGHVKPATFLDTKEKLLISIATKGVVKLFNAVNKAQNPQKDLNPSRSKDAKELAKRRKQAFLSEINKSATEKSDHGFSFYSTKVTKSASKENDDEPGWAPLRDSYILNNSKLKDWDRIPEFLVAPRRHREWYFDCLSSL
ncbi:RRP15-like protein isoform X2 [Asparagus officinalis]|uniref:RRP15-like protein isoform X2 n=1 Tax=Asparagus officinalis TaxID=4686 RepID=UPI00098E2784|nr:RRP15-like protein isoform X2 [Asparagus officinalis]